MERRGKNKQNRKFHSAIYNSYTYGYIKHVSFVYVWYVKKYKTSQNLAYICSVPETAVFTLKIIIKIMLQYKIYLRRRAFLLSFNVLNKIFLCCSMANFIKINENVASFELQE